MTVSLVVSVARVVTVVLFLFCCDVHASSISSGERQLHLLSPATIAELRQRHTRQVAGNIDAALRNPSFVRFQLSCLLDRSPCDRIGQRIKRLLPEMVATGQCSVCSPQEIGQAGKVVLFIQEHYPMEYDLLEKKFLSDAQLQEEPNFE